MSWYEDLVKIVIKKHKAQAGYYRVQLSVNNDTLNYRGYNVAFVNSRSLITSFSYCLL
jgi:hypothetical protein